jgi:hypothetical protein
MRRRKELGVQHLVIYGSADGKPSFFQAEDLGAAVRFAEHLVNVENITDSRIFELLEVPIEFKTYYRVEVGHAGNGAGVTTTDGAAVPEQAGPVDDAVTAVAGDVTAPAGVPSGSPSGRFGLFSRG